MTLMPLFDRYPQEAAIVGRLIAGLGELEVQLVRCAEATGISRVEAINILFPVKPRKLSAQKRIELALKTWSATFQQLHLEKEFQFLIEALHWCRDVRNQYAHCVWSFGFDGVLAFLSLEEFTASALDDLYAPDVPLRYVDLDVLESQEDYFVFVKRYAEALLSAAISRGAGRAPVMTYPESVERPEPYMKASPLKL